jgi:predicted NAD/FAD-binding protein
VRERIAIIGSGIGGLGCLRFLAAHHNVTVFDRDSRPGGHAHNEWDWQTLLAHMDTCFKGLPAPVHETPAGLLEARSSL